MIACAPVSVVGSPSVVPADVTPQRLDGHPKPRPVVDTPNPASEVGVQDIDAAGGLMVPRRRANLLGDDRKQQVRVLGQPGWTLRRIEGAPGVRRETASAYLKAAGIAVRDPRHRHLTAPNPASEASTDSATLPPGITGPLTWPVAARAASACEPYRDLIAGSRTRGRDAMPI
jgi:hypothetical protein